MKSLYYVVLACLVFGCASTMPPAGPAPTIMDEADAIWILTEDTPEEAYRRIAQTLTDRGYSISDSDPVLQNITTEPREQTERVGDALVGGKMSLKINASVRKKEDTMIKLTAKYSTTGLYGTKDKEVINAGNNSSYTRRGWNELLKVAEACGGTLMYSRNY